MSDPAHVGDVPTRADSGGEPTARVDVPPELELPSVGPTAVGRYVLYEQISRGAFGTVYAAFDPDLDRKVALKLVRDAPDERGHTSVLMEAQATAQITHPNVIAIHDVGRVSPVEAQRLTGTVEQDLVFLVMEFLSGPTLRAWIREEKPRERAIVDAFLEAAAGLAAAHERRLVHLDFKPSNAMFAADGRLRVLDFGLARVVHRRARTPDGADATGEEGSSEMTAGTPPYMAPEQHAGEATDGRADQYALCVALFEALLGRRPFPGTELTELAKQKARGIAATDVAGVPRYLRRVLLTGLRPDPADRFESMAALARALEAGRRRGRRRIQTAAVVGAGVLAAGLATAFAREDPASACAGAGEVPERVWGPQLREQARQAFLASGNRAAEEAWTATAAGVDRYLEAWSGASDRACQATLVTGEASPEVMNDRVICLDRGMNQLAGLTQLLAVADGSIVRVAPHSVSSLPDPASCLADPAASGRDRAGAGASMENVAELESDLARVRMLGEAARLDEARALSAETVRRVEAAGATALVPRALAAEAEALLLGLDYEASRALQVRALSAALSIGDDETAVRVKLLMLRTYVEQGLTGEALAVGRLVQAHVDAAYPGTVLQAEALGTLASLRLARFDNEEALALLEQNLALQERLHGPDHPALALTLNNLGNAHLRLEAPHAETRSYYERAIELWTRAYGAHFWRVGGTLNNIAIIHTQTGDLPAARDAYERAREILAAAYPDGHPFVANVEFNLGDVYLRLGQYHRAIQACETAREIRVRVGADRANAMANINVAEAIARMWLEESEGVPGLLQDARDLYADTADEPHKYSHVIVTQARYLEHTGQWEALDRTIDELYEVGLSQGPDGVEMEQYLRFQAHIALHDGDARGALEHLDRVAAFPATESERAERKAWDQIDRGKALLTLGRPGDALAGCEGAIDYVSSRLRPEHPGLAALHLCAARAQRALGVPDSVRTHLERARQLTAGEDASPRLRAEVVGFR